jgi:Ca2+:H+ antiporter
MLVSAKWLNVLLLAVPVALVAWFLDRQGPYAGQLTNWIFAFALLAVIPLATTIGGLTETLATYFGDRVGGLLGASFGNVPELAIGIFLLVHARVHAASPVVLQSDFEVLRGLLIGSVINNILFVLGSSIFVAALRNGRMNFSAASATGYTSMLALAVVGLALPTLATGLAENAGPNAQVDVSIPFGIILIASYVAYIMSSVFDVGAHRKRASTPKRAQQERGPAEDALALTEGMPVLADDPAHETVLEKEIESEEATDDSEKIRLRQLRREHANDVAIAVVGLAIVTLLTVVIAGLLVSVTDNVIQNTPLTPLSVGLILFPIVCNLGEQAGSVVEAWRNRMEAAMSVAAGSSVQVALFVTPLLVLASFPIGGFATPLILTLIFRPLELIVLGLVCFVYALVSLDGETTWLEGLQLLAFYAMIVAVAFALPGT